MMFGILMLTGEATLTDALTAAGKTYEEIAQMVAEQVLITFWTVKSNNSPDRSKRIHSRSWFFLVTYTRLCKSI